MAMLITQQPAGSTPVMFDHEYFSSMADKRKKDNDPAFFKGEFSFVNKDANNIESKDHNAAVSWHVMNRYERWKKQEQARKLRASANVPIGPLSTSARNSPSESHRSSQSRSRGSPPTSTTQPAATPSTLFGLDPWTVDPSMQPTFSASDMPSLPATGSFLPSAVSSPSTHSSSHDDPFAMLSFSPSVDMPTTTDNFDVQLPTNNPLANRLVSFAYETLIPQLWPTEAGNVPGHYEISRSWDDAAAISQDVCYANAYLALLAVALAQSSDDSTLSQHAGTFKSQAMTELRQRVAARTGTQDLLTLKAILKLFCAETIIDNTAVARVHLKMLRSLVVAGGGVILLDSWFREDLLSCDCYFALKYGTRPVLPAAEWTPGPLSQPWKARLVSAGIFGDHTAGLDNLIEHPILKAVAMDLRELFRAQEYILTHEVPTEDQLLRWRQLRKFDCISRLADHYTNLTIYAHLYDFPRTQMMVTLTIALLGNMVLGCPEPIRFGKKLLRELRNKVDEATVEVEESDSQRLRYWALYIGSLAERVYGNGNEHEDWFAKQLKTMAAGLRLESWEDTKKMLRQLLFSVRLHQEVEGRRAHRTNDFTTGLYSICGTSWRQPLLPQSPTDRSSGKGKGRGS